MTEINLRIYEPTVVSNDSGKGIGLVLSDGKRGWIKDQNPDLTDDQIDYALDVMHDPLNNPSRPIEQKIEAVATSDHPPCGTCGGNFFMRTGTCFVCENCGTSQGCS